MASKTVDSKSNAPLVSVIITNYNYAQYIKEAIDSVLNQTYNNIELIIIDDGSIDDSLTVIKKAIKEKSTVRLIAQKNHGIVYTRNLGLKEAKGKYICFLDADDYWDKEYLEEMYSLAVKSNADVVYPNWRMMWHDENGRYLRTTEPKWGDFDLVGYQLQKMHVSSESLIKKSAIGQHRFRWEKVAEDWDFFIGLALDGRKFEFARNCFINYRIKPASRGSASSETEDIQEFIKILVNYKKVYKNTIEPHDLVLLKFKEKNQYAINLEVQIRSFESKVNELRQQNDILRRQNADLQNSLSWKITQPLRSVRRSMKRLL